MTKTTRYLNLGDTEMSWSVGSCVGTESNIIVTDLLQFITSPENDPNSLITDMASLRNPDVSHNSKIASSV